MKLALWDSEANRTVWVATNVLKPTASDTQTVYNGTKRKKKQGNRVIWVGSYVGSSLSQELRSHPGRFPTAPGREPAFSKSFDDFALSLPLQPSEAKLIEYEHFTYHRPELGFSYSQIGDAASSSLVLAFSSVINYRLRFGGGIYFPLGGSDLKFEDEPIDVTMLAYGGSFDYEWELTPTKRLLTGFFTGGAAFTKTYPNDPADDTDDPTDDEEYEDRSETDGTFIFWPRAHILLGDKGGFQWKFGGTYRFFDGVEDGFLKQHRPAPWSVDLGVAYAFRGF